MRERGWTRLADALEDADGVLEVADVEDGNHKLDVRVMSNTIDRIQSTGLAECTLVRRALQSLYLDVYSVACTDPKRTSRRSNTPSFTGALSIGVYRSR